MNNFVKAAKRNFTAGGIREIRPNIPTDAEKLANERDTLNSRKTTNKNPNVSWHRDY